MTAKEWVFFILFNIAINVILQVLAWKIAFSIGKKKDGYEKLKTSEEDVDKDELDAPSDTMV